MRKPTRKVLSLIVTVVFVLTMGTATVVASVGEGGSVRQGTEQGIETQQDVSAGVNGAEQEINTQQDVSAGLNGADNDSSENHKSDGNSSGNNSIESSDSSPSTDDEITMIVTCGILIVLCLIGVLLSSYRRKKRFK